jgi:choline dehydrogenase
MRSGIGPAEELRALNIPVRYDLPGIGRNLHDHVGVWVVCSLRPDAPAVLREPPAWRSQVVLRARTPAEAPDRYDLHVLPYQWPSENNREEYVLGIGACVMTPRSRGRVELRSPDPLVAPRVDFGYITDLEGEDLNRLVYGLRVISAVAQNDPLATVVTLPPELERHPSDYIFEHVGGYAHPVGTCRMGPASEPEAVVDGRGRVYGLENVFVADASVIPVIPRANTNLTCMLIGTRIGDLLVEDTGLT